MVALDEITEARRLEVERAHRERLEALVDDVRKALEGPKGTKEKVARIKALLAIQGYRVQE
ncbi:hypothetical protein ABIB83_004715 [Bradyrhizobium sp. I1.8.5]|uniref:hypothetical protein n=1 Tax=unclassified Bradyrhizobium TaxID=2631580 RepID=UPI0033976BF3